ncbi:MAG: sigma-70 family RNA polymerase sigma factor [Gammaproteobacteria bacterium]|nr:sigma-70 family RNA polymerase sigma factor [Gammaproteobacteria bacterium]
MSLDDRTLIGRVLNENDQRAFAELVKRHQSQLRYSLRQITGWDHALADDLAQETFIKAYKSLHQFRGDAKFFTWLYRIAYHCFLAHRRSLKPEEQLKDDADVPDAGHDPGAAADLHRDLARAMLVLSPEQRMALHLHLHRELTHEEVAEIMNCPLGTAKSHIQRGREKLRDQLSSWRSGSPA